MSFFTTLVHDICKLILLQSDPQGYHEIVQRIYSEYQPFGGLEIERYDVRAREWYWKYRAAIGAENALSFARHVATTHVDSRRVLEHLLRVGDMYAELARTTVAQADPADHTHDPALLRGLVREALAVYAEVAAVDGRPEREEARAAMVQLEALLARVEEG